MTLLDAQEIDPAKARRRRQRMIAAIVFVVVVFSIGVLAFLFGYGWFFWYLPERRVAGHFFNALQKQDYNTAYGVWMQDPDWRQHAERHPNYPFGEFYRDWGPGGQWGLIKTYEVYGAGKCPPHGAVDSGTGIVVDVVVNDRAEHAQVWVEKSDHTMSYAPCEGELVFH
jgi:nitrate reductase NapE component